jgi:hypothetical protein
VTDVELLREAHKALKRCVRLLKLAAAGIAPEYRGEHNAYDEASEQGDAAIAKLEERLLKE